MITVIIWAAVVVLGIWALIAFALILYLVAECRGKDELIKELNRQHWEFVHYVSMEQPRKQQPGETKTKVKGGAPDWAQDEAAQNALKEFVEVCEGMDRGIQPGQTQFIQTFEKDENNQGRRLTDGGNNHA